MEASKTPKMGDWNVNNVVLKMKWCFFVPCWWLFLAKTFNIAPSNIAHHNWHVCDHMSMGRVPIGYRRIQSCEPSIGTREWKVISQRGSFSCSRPTCFQDKGWLVTCIANATCLASLAQARTRPTPFPHWDAGSHMHDQARPGIADFSWGENLGNAAWNWEVQRAEGRRYHNLPLVQWREAPCEGDV